MTLWATRCGSRQPGGTPHLSMSHHTDVFASAAQSPIASCGGSRRDSSTAACWVRVSPAARAVGWCVAVWERGEGVEAGGLFIGTPAVSAADKETETRGRQPEREGPRSPAVGSAIQAVPVCWFWGRAV
ncbi:hypothetical protein E2562_025388 [Oryza meyeriana var. granulata]|uniref:Uncharacterized protein n=1 Tax=Oryza meyeriana var. granulata TaxID=110450 RepID=A0A6G1DNA3_9ORYZ|nr:hypothetical protein E2562_025388 [Oryza meyeriana var. granulata]